MSIKPWSKLIMNEGIPIIVWDYSMKYKEEEREKERSISLYKKRYIMFIKPWP